MFLYSIMHYITDIRFFHYFKFLKSDIPYCFAYISSLLDRAIDPRFQMKYVPSLQSEKSRKLGCKFLHQEKSDLEAIGETDKIEGSEENSVTNEKLITLEDQLRKAKEKNESYSDIIKKAGVKTKLLEDHNKKLKEKLLEYRSALQKLTDAYETK